MGKNKCKKEKETVFECPYSTCPTDKPTNVASLGWRFAYTIVAWFILGHNIDPTSGFFVSLVLFSAPLLMDYLRFEPDKKFRIWLKKTGVFMSATWTIVGFLGLSNILKLEKSSNAVDTILKVSNNFVVLKDATLSMKSIWFTIGLSVMITGLDWFTYESNLEKQLIRETKNLPQNM